MGFQLLLRSGGNEESVFEGGGSMVRKQQTVASSAQATMDASQIPTLKAAALQPANSTESTIIRAVRLVRSEATTQTPAPSKRTLSDTAVLKILEKRRPSDGSAANGSGTSNVPVLPPEDTSTRRALREAVAKNEPVFFAVQLQWSVQPIDVTTLSPHPIFKAYSLYGAQGRRAGRTWFFVRLGFFSDANSAKQVADYLRAEFGSAAVVPVSPQERQQVKQNGLCTDVCAVARGPA
jgi:hypothetical protein